MRHMIEEGCFYRNQQDMFGHKFL